MSAGAAPAQAGPASVVVSPGAGLTVALPATGQFAAVTLDSTAQSAQAHFGPFPAGS